MAYLFRRVPKWHQAGTQNSGFVADGEGWHESPGALHLWRLSSAYWVGDA